MNYFFPDIQKAMQNFRKTVGHIQQSEQFFLKFYMASSESALNEQRNLHQQTFLPFPFCIYD